MDGYSGTAALLTGFSEEEYITAKARPMGSEQR
jgi:hypothetical protein